MSVRIPVAVSSLLACTLVAWLAPARPEAPAARADGSPLTLEEWAQVRIVRTGTLKLFTADMATGLGIRTVAWRQTPATGVPEAKVRLSLGLVPGSSAFGK